MPPENQSPQVVGNIQQPAPVPTAQELRIAELERQLAEKGKLADQWTAVKGKVGIPELSEDELAEYVAMTMLKPPTEEPVQQQVVPAVQPQQTVAQPAPVGIPPELQARLDALERQNRSVIGYMGDREIRAVIASEPELAHCANELVKMAYTEIQHDPRLTPELAARRATATMKNIIEKGHQTRLQKLQDEEKKRQDAVRASKPAAQQLSVQSQQGVNFTGEQQPPDMGPQQAVRVLARPSYDHDVVKTSPRSTYKQKTIDDMKAAAGQLFDRMGFGGAVQSKDLA